MISVKEAAGIVGVSEDMVRRYIRGRKLSAQKVGHAVIMDRDEVVAFAKARNKVKGL